MPGIPSRSTLRLRPTPTTGWPTTPTALPEMLTTSDWIVEGPLPHGSTRNLSALGLQPTDRWEAQAATEYLCIAPFSEKGRSDAPLNCSAQRSLFSEGCPLIERQLAHLRVTRSLRISSTA